MNHMISGLEIPESSQFTKLNAADSEGNRITRQHLAMGIAQKIKAFMDPIVSSCNLSQI